jgi:hypothetical protein
MANQSVLGCITSIPNVAAAAPCCSGRLRGQCVTSGIPSCSSSRQSSGFLGNTHPFNWQLQFDCRGSSSAEVQGRCRARKSQLGFLCSAAIVDQNERLKDAAKAGDLEDLNEILRLAEVTIDLPSSNRAGWTALHLASFYGHSSIVESLLQAGANVEVRNDSGNTPLQVSDCYSSW